MDNADIAQKRIESTLEQACSDAHHALRIPKTIKHQHGKRICLDCESFIPSKRIKVAPFAVRCIGCQRLHETIRC